VFPQDHPLQNIETIPKDNLLDTQVEPDSVGELPETKDEEDPVVTLPENTPAQKPQPKIYGSPRLQRRLRKLIKEFDDVFAVELSPTPAAITPMTFNIDREKWKADRRSKQYPRPLSKDKEQWLAKWIQASLASGIISPAPAVPNWSQVLLVIKPHSQEYRFCVDYTVLNSFMESAGWPIPHIGSILRRIASHRPKYFSTMDCTQGFYNMEVELDYREFLCFTTYMGNYMWNRAPMGPKTVPAAFQRAMCVEVFPDLIHKIMEVYIDDFIVWADNEDEMITRLRCVFTRLREKNLKLNPKKCHFGMQEVQYCGHVITSEGVSFSQERINEVANFDVPLTQGALKSFLGMAGYMREHVSHYGEMAKPLQDIVAHYSKRKKKQPIDWTPELLQAFADFKQHLSNLQTLYHRDDSADIRVYTDASKYGIGAYICQVIINAEGKLVEQPLGFISKSLTATERRWSVYEKEAYAIFYACKKWEHFLRGVHFYLFTDHKNLTFLNRPPSEKVMRWRLSIQEFDFSVAYIKGENNNVADAMSRCLPNPEPDKEEQYTRRHTVLQYLNGAVPMFGILSAIPDSWYSLVDNHTYKRVNRVLQSYPRRTCTLDGIEGLRTVSE
jgi:hypothetical protein